MTSIFLRMEDDLIKKIQLKRITNFRSCRWGSLFEDNLRKNEKGDNLKINQP